MTPGKMREIKRLRAMDWDGWERPSPEHLEE
jgi:hypothetical protein